MPKLVVASVQQQMRLFDSQEEYRKELNRFFYLARAKAAKLLVFPALTGVMAAAPQVEGFRINLLRRADERNRRQQNVWTRTRGAIAGQTAKMLKVSFRKALAELVAQDPEALRSAYEGVFSGLARAYEITVVAGTTYLPDTAGVLRHQATVFGPDGTVLGRHNKLILGPQDESLAMPGNEWTAIDTPAGRVGILLGEEALYPEAGRLLAYQGADLLVTLGATASDSAAAYMRQGTLARVQENQCFGLASFLVGKNYLAETDQPGGEFLGRAGIYAPLEMTPRFTGVLVEMGTTNSEGLLASELDRDELRTLWRTGLQPVRTQMPSGVFSAVLPPLYGKGQTLTEALAGREAALALPQPLPPLPPAMPAESREPTPLPQSAEDEQREEGPAMEPEPGEPAPPAPENPDEETGTDEQHQF